MTYWEGVLARLSVPGIIFMAVGALLYYEAPKVCQLVLKEKGARAVVPMKGIGLVMVLLGVLILLDFIPM